jgi:transglutaminase superfamily protein
LFAWPDPGRFATRLALRVHVALLALIVPPLATLLPLRKLLDLVTPKRSIAAYRNLSPSEFAAAATRRLRHPWVMRRRRCLREGLIVFHLLRLAGVPAALHFAVYRFDQHRSLAHCWVVVADACVTQPAPPSAALVLVYPT